VYSLHNMDMWMPTCGLPCGSACPATGNCKSFLACSKGPMRGGAGPAPVHSPVQISMGEEEESRRCRLYSASMPRLRSAALPVTSVGADLWRKWVARPPEAAEAGCASLLEESAEKVHVPMRRGRPVGKSGLSSLDEEHVLFQARPASSPPSRDASPKGRLCDSWMDSWEDSPTSSPRKCSEAKGQQSRLSTASTSAGSSCFSPGRRDSRQSCSSWTSMSMMQEPPVPVGGKALLTSFPVPLGIRAWDWPLSRDEKKALVLMFDRQEIMEQRDEYADQLSTLHGQC